MRFFASSWIWISWYYRKLNPCLGILPNNQYVPGVKASQVRIARRIVP
jgi:hypothetical protein